VQGSIDGKFRQAPDFRRLYLLERRGRRWFAAGAHVVNPRARNVGHDDSVAAVGSKLSEILHVCLAVQPRFGGIVSSQAMRRNNSLHHEIIFPFSRRTPETVRA
jgi:hypothetical protein